MRISEIMKKISALLFSFFILMSAAFASDQVQTPIGLINIATEKELQSAKELLSSSELSEEDKQKASMLYTKAAENLVQIKNFQTIISDFEKELLHLNKTIAKLSYEYNKENSEEPLSDQYISSLSEDALRNLITKRLTEQQKVQNEYDFASSEASRIQTLPERAQSTIISNNEKIRYLSEKISKNPDPEAFENRAYATGILRMTLESNFLNLQLSNISLMQDINSYQLKTATHRRSRLDQDIKKLTAQKSVFLEETANEDLSDIASHHSKLSALISKISFIQENTRNYTKKNAEFIELIQVLDRDLSNITQIEKNIKSQIQELGKTLVLSRLLNKQKSLIPSFTIKENFSELIPNLNIYLYDIREMTTALTDIEEAVNKEIAVDESLKPYKAEFKTVMIKRKEALKELYQVIANQLALAIQLKMKYEDFCKKQVFIHEEIDEQLFWIKSNQPLGVDLVKQFIPFVKYNFSNLLVKLNSESFKLHCLDTALVVLLPLLIFAVVAKLFGATIIRKNNRLVRNIDTPNDSITNTLTGIFYNIVLMLPKLSIMIFIGTTVICLSLSNFEKQTVVILTMCLHFFVYTFSLQIVKPNALVQRHFSVAPYKIEKMREVFNSVWFYVLPLLIFANIAEADVDKIFFDITAYSIILISFIALSLISLKIFIKNLKTISEGDSGRILISLLALIAALCCVIAVASGYLYTTVKLLNSIALTCYIILGYYFIKETVHRTMHVMILKHFEKKASKKENSILSLVGKNPSLLTEKVFKLTRYTLITLTVLVLYWQWSDIASVLSYLKSITVWSKISYINGIPTEVDSLTLANIFIAIVIFIFTFILNHNLPGILEKIILLNSGSSNSVKSTGYTVKVISSYVILGLGFIFSAGAIGIKWENLQWLVAALSVGLGFGIQEIFANFVSGIILLFERQTRVGDIITLNGLSGTVKKIRIRATTVMSFEHKEVLIPNRAFITSELTNWSLSNTVTKLVFDVGVAYDANVDLARKILHRIIRETNLISKEMAPLIYIKELADSSVNFSCEVYVGTISNRKLTLDYLCTRTLSEFRKAGIEIPFNQLDVNVKTLEKEEFIEKLKQGLFSKNGIDDSKVLENTVNSKI